MNMTTISDFIEVLDDMETAAERAAQIPDAYYRAVFIAHHPDGETIWLIDATGRESLETIAYGAASRLHSALFSGDGNAAEQAYRELLDDGRLLSVIALDTEEAEMWEREMTGNSGRGWMIAYLGNNGNGDSVECTQWGSVLSSLAIW